MKRRHVLNWAGQGLLLAFLGCVFLFCLFTLALILVATGIGLVQVVNGYRPEGGNPLVEVVAFLTTVLCVGGIGVNAYLGVKYVVGEIRR